MAQVCSNGFSSTEETSMMAADQALLKNSNSNIFGDVDSMRCDRCKSKKKKVAVVCVDCGDLPLCSDCSKKVHANNNQVNHQIHELRTNETTENNSDKSKNVNPSSNHHKKSNSVAKLEIVHNDKPKSLLLIDSTEKLQVVTIKLFFLYCSQGF